MVRAAPPSQPADETTDKDRRKRASRHGLVKEPALPIAQEDGQAQREAAAAAAARAGEGVPQLPCARLLRRVRAQVPLHAHHHPPPSLLLLHGRDALRRTPPTPLRRADSTRSDTPAFSPHATRASNANPYVHALYNEEKEQSPFGFISAALYLLCLRAFVQNRRSKGEGNTRSQ